MTALFGQLGSASNSEVQIPLPQSERPRVRPEALSDVEIEAAIVPLFDYLDATLPTFNTYLSESTKEVVMTRVWKEILNVIEGLLIPPLSDISSEMKPLSDKEVDIVFKWLKAGLRVCVCWTSVPDSGVAVPARLLLRGRRGAGAPRVAPEPKVP